MTSTRSSLPAGFAALLVAGAVAACSTPGSSPSTSASPTGSASSSSTSPTTRASETPEQLAQTAATAMVTTFYRDHDLGMFDPQRTTADFFKASAIGSALVDQQNAVNAAKAQGVRQTGDTTLKSVSLLKLDLTNDPKASPPKVPTVQFLVCYDVSKVDIVDRSGKSVVPASRKPTGLVRVGVSNYSYPSVDAWRVAYTEKKADTC